MTHGDGIAMNTHTHTHTDIVELVAGYRAYAAADEIDVHSSAAPPATTVPCGVASSQACAAGVASAVSAVATYFQNC